MEKLLLRKLWKKKQHQCLLKPQKPVSNANGGLLSVLQGLADGLLGHKMDDNTPNGHSPVDLSINPPINWVHRED